MSDKVRCVSCGHYISNTEMRFGLARFKFEPLNEFGPEISEWECRNCANTSSKHESTGAAGGKQSPAVIAEASRAKCSGGVANDTTR